ncbi:MAG: TrkA family potassium uptake protein [Candidatus Margulisiibacteriota bacterium]|nr:TrkA family potassium uptake protein [Candidatus Margulisiibacteriota bacterium]MBU1871138.1 TrkA family potassium uptake protein [Patescibacteria group bacterium]
MHIIIVGCGRVGSQMALMLTSEGHDVVVIDKKSSSFKRLGPSFNGITITGIGFDPEILKRAGIERAGAVVAVTNGDNSNIMVGQIAKKLFNVPKVLSRLYDPERALIYQEAGMDIICTTMIQANIIKDAVLEKSRQHEFSFGKDKKVNITIDLKPGKGN